MNLTLYEAIGGLPTLQKVHKIFYDKVYAHQWLGKFFEGHDQKVIENKQSGFMAEKMGSTAPYLGKEIKMVHETMYISEELFDIRHRLLDESIKEAGVNEVLRKRWLRIDSAFMRLITKESVESMFNNDWPFKKPIIIPNPAAKEL
jgi:hemoglobin